MVVKRIKSFKDPKSCTDNVGIQCEEKSSDSLLFIPPFFFFPSLLGENEVEISECHFPCFVVCGGLLLNPNAEEAVDLKSSIQNRKGFSLQNFPEKAVYGSEKNKNLGLEWSKLFQFLAKE